MEQINRAIGHNPFTSIAKAATVALVGLPYLTAVTAWNIFNEKPKEPEPMNHAWIGLGVTAMVLTLSSVWYFCFRKASQHNPNQNELPSIPQSTSTRSSSSTSSSSSSSQAVPTTILPLAPDLFGLSKTQLLELFAQANHKKYLDICTLESRARPEFAAQWLSLLNASLDNFNVAMAVLEQECQGDKYKMINNLLGYVEGEKGINLPIDMVPHALLVNILNLYYIYRRSCAPEQGKELFTVKARPIGNQEREAYLGFKCTKWIADLIVDPILLAQKPLAEAERCFYDPSTPEGQMRNAYNTFIAQWTPFLSIMYRGEEQEGHIVGQDLDMCTWLAQDQLVEENNTNFFHNRHNYYRSIPIDPAQRHQTTASYADLFESPPSNSPSSSSLGDQI